MYLGCQSLARSFNKAVMKTCENPFTHGKQMVSRLQAGWCEKMIKGICDKKFHLVWKEECALPHLNSSNSTNFIGGKFIQESDLDPTRACLISSARVAMLGMSWKTA
jgi:hypothetical protein